MADCVLNPGNIYQRLEKLKARLIFNRRKWKDTWKKN